MYNWHQLTMASTDQSGQVNSGCTWSDRSTVNRRLVSKSAFPAKLRKRKKRSLGHYSILMHSQAPRTHCLQCEIALALWGYLHSLLVRTPSALRARKFWVRQFREKVQPWQRWTTKDALWKAPRPPAQSSFQAGTFDMFPSVSICFHLFLNCF